MPSIVELADGVLQVAAQPGINVWVLRHDPGVVLVDAGLAAPGLVRALRRLGVAPRDVTGVLLTHGHPDHAGGLARLRRAGGDGWVRVGEGDLATVRGLAPQPDSDPSTRLGRVINRLPPPPGFGPTDPVPTASGLRDGDHLDVAGGLHGGRDAGSQSRTRRLPPARARGRHRGRRVVQPLLAAAGAGVPVLGRAGQPPGDRHDRRPRPSTLGLAHGSAVTDDVGGRLRQVLADAP